MLGYRKKVVRKNLQSSFPEKSKTEIKKIEKDFYKYLSQLFVEFIKNLSISKEELQKRVQVLNPEILDNLYDEGKSVILAGAHYHNWEYLITSQNLLFKHQATGIGLPLTNSFWDKKINERRARFGMRVTNAKNIKEKLHKWKEEKLAILVLFDQSPPDSRKSYWTTFLHQNTAFLFGTEKMAVEHDFPVVQFTMQEPQKGYYEIQLELITSNPRQENYGYITESLAKNLEKVIIKSPPFWLWSHKRWKREVPKELDSLKEQQRIQFEMRKSELK